LHAVAAEKFFDRHQAFAHGLDAFWGNRADAGRDYQAAFRRLQNRARNASAGMIFD
jgi:hypothetical protein